MLKNAFFTYESEVSSFGFKGRNLIWREENTALQSSNVIPSTKPMIVSILVWGSMVWSGTSKLAIIEGIIGARKSLDKLWHYLFEGESNLRIGNDF